MMNQYKLQPKIKRFHKISVQKFSSYVFTKSQSRISINLCCFFLSKHIWNSWNYVWLGSPSDDLYLLFSNPNVFISINTTETTTKKKSFLKGRLCCCSWTEILFRSSPHIFTNSQSRILTILWINQNESSLFICFFKLFIFQSIQPKLQPKN